MSDNDDAATPVDDGLRIHYRSEVVEKMTTLINIWSSPRFQRDIASEEHRSLSVIEVRIIWTLGSLGPSRTSELAAALGAGAPSVSKAVARLDAAGLIVRRAVAGDQRAHTLHLTDLGRGVAQNLYDAGDAMVADIFTTWNESDVASLSALLVRFVDDSERFAKRIAGSTS